MGRYSFIDPNKVAVTGGVNITHNFFSLLNSNLKEMFYCK